MSIKFTNVNYVYSPGSPLEKQALNHISFEIESNRFIAIVGHTGSGKSTLMQHFNALLKPTSGKIEINGYEITPDTKDNELKGLRKKVSLVFQFPETQLFETSVIDDIAFGPKNFGYSEEDAKSQAYIWLEKVGLSQDIADKSPFDLSGGQMRRVAIAGVMAYQPEIICLDEPAAGLDPEACKQMMKLFSNYQKAGHTVILVTHNMEDVVNYADDVLVLEHGSLIKHASPKELFANQNWVRQHALQEPLAAEFASKLKNFNFSEKPLTMTSLLKQIEDNLKR